MFKNRWGLKQQAFTSQGAEEYYFDSKVHSEAMSRMAFLVEERRQLGILLGDRGTGKSTVLKMFADQQRTQGLPVASFSLLKMNEHEMLWQLARQFGLNPSEQTSLNCLWRIVCDHLTENRYQKLQTIILLDDVDQAEVGITKSILRLVQYESIEQSHLTVVLSCPVYNISQLGQRLLERTDLRIDLLAWNEEETSRYLNDTLTKAGGSSTVFEQQALEKLYELSHGIPKSIKQITDLALIAGTGNQLDQIDATTIENVFSELAMPIE